MIVFCSRFCSSASTTGYCTFTFSTRKPAPSTSPSKACDSIAASTAAKNNALLALAAQIRTHAGELKARNEADVMAAIRRAREMMDAFERQQGRRRP